MSTLAALAALPAASARRLGAAPLAASRAGSSARPTRPLARARRRRSSAASGSTSGSRVGLWLAVAVGAARRRATQLARHLRRREPALRRRPRRRRARAAAAREARARSSPPPAIVLATGTGVELVHTPVARDRRSALLWLVGMTNAFNLLDNMDGLAGEPRRRSRPRSSRSTPSTIHPDRTLVLVLVARARAVRVRRASCRSTCGRGGNALVFMGDSGSQLLGFTLAALGLAVELNVAASTVATLLLPVLVLAVPILDTTLVTIVRLLEGRPVSQGGRDHSSHRLVSLRGLREARRRAARAGRGRARRDEPRLQRARRPARIALVGVLVTFALLVQFASFLADVERRAATPEAPSCCSVLRALAAARRGRRRLRADRRRRSPRPTCCASAAGTTNQRHFVQLTLPVLIAARYLALHPRSASTARSGATRARATRCDRRRGRRVSEVVALGYVALDADGFGDFSRAFFVIDALHLRGADRGLAVRRARDRRAASRSLRDRDRQRGR